MKNIFKKVLRYLIHISISIWLLVITALLFSVAMDFSDIGQHKMAENLNIYIVITLVLLFLFTIYTVYAWVSRKY